MNQSYWGMILTIRYRSTQGDPLSFWMCLVCLFLAATKGAGEQYLGVNWSEEILPRKRRFPIQLVSQFLWRVTMQRGQPQRSGCKLPQAFHQENGFKHVLVSQFNPISFEWRPPLTLNPGLPWVYKIMDEMKMVFLLKAHVRWLDVHVEDSSFIASSFRGVQVLVCQHCTLWLLYKFAVVSQTLGKICKYNVEADIG